MSGKPTRRAVRALSVQEKLEAIDRVHAGESKAAVARDIEVPESTLRGWCKGEEKLRAAMARPVSPPPSPPFRKLPRLSDASDEPLDFSSRDKLEERSQSPVLIPKLDPDPLMYLLGQASLPPSPMEGRTAENGSWFWKLYKSYGLAATIMETKKDEKKGKEEFDAHAPTTAAAAAALALQHGEKFLQWLEECSDPGITALQILQFRYLLNNVKDSAERHKQVPRQKVHRRK